MSTQLNLFAGEQTLTSLEVYDYFLVISPPEFIDRETRLRKRRLHAEIGLSDVNLWSIPHISLLKFSWTEQFDLIFSVLQNRLLGVRKFFVELANLYTFEHGTRKSLVLLFKDPEPICRIQNLMLDGLGARKRGDVPHLTIARNVPVEDYNRISNISQYFIKGGFACDRVTVLRKPAAQKTGYKVFREILLGL